MVDSPEGADTLVEKVRHAIKGDSFRRRTPILLLGVPTLANETDVKGGLTTFGVTLSDIPKMSLKGGAMAVFTGPHLLRSLTTRPSR